MITPRPPRRNPPAPNRRKNHGKSGILIVAEGRPGTLIVAEGRRGNVIVAEKHSSQAKVGPGQEMSLSLSQPPNRP